MNNEFSVNVGDFVLHIERYESRSVNFRVSQVDIVKNTCVKLKKYGVLDINEIICILKNDENEENENCFFNLNDYREGNTK